MKLNIEQKKLVDLVNIASRGVSAKSDMPILTGLLLETTDNGLRATATNLEIAIKHEVQAEILEEGRTVVSGKLLAEIAKMLPDAEVNLEVDEKLKIKCKRSKFELSTMNPDEFPADVMESKDGEFKTITGLKEMIDRVIFAVSKDEARPIFQGILFELNKSGLTLVSTDTYRLAIAISRDITADEEIKVIIPGKTLGEVAKMISDETQVQMKVTEKHVTFKIGETIVVSRVIDGNFPSYKQVIPQKTVTKMQVGSREFLEAVQRAGLVAKKQVKDKISPIKLQIKDDIVRIEASAADVGTLSEEIAAEISGEQLEIAFNPIFLEQGLKCFSGDNKVEIHFSGPLSPAFMKKENYLYLILPIRIL